MRVLAVEDVAMIIQRHGFNEILLDLVSYLKADFQRWNEFDKSARQACHVKDGVIELMPVCDAQFHTYKYVTGHPNNPLKNKQTVVATGQISQVSDGYPLMVSEMTILTALRTAATSLIASQYLARPNSKKLAIIGTGAQSEFQTLAHNLSFAIDTVNYYDIDPQAMTKYAHNLRNSGLKLNACSDVASALADCDIIIVCTACKKHAQVVHDAWVQPGMHISALGGDCPGKTELELSLILRSKIVVEFIPQSLIEGEIQLLNPSQVVRDAN